MPRYIDADNLIHHDIKDIHGDVLDAIYADEIDNAPTADVAPVVRCKDCKNAWHSLEGLRCCIWATSEENCETEPDAFCSFGERMEDT